MDESKDPFRDDRATSGIHRMECEGETIPLLLRLRDVRRTAKDWKTFSSDNPLMIMPHSEAHVRTVRQLPLEVDPPDHGDYRAMVEPLFRRANEPEYREAMREMIDRMVAKLPEQGEIDAVREFALPVQSRALARLLKVGEAGADLWISWGIHVFRDSKAGAGEGAALERYTTRKFEEAANAPGDDFFSLLNEIEFRGRKLTMEEKNGFANVTFAGGRDTVIHTVSGIIAHLAEHPEDLARLRADPALRKTATEEFVRWVSPLTALTRKCPHGATVGGEEVPEGGRVGLCWSSANRDERAFEAPEEVRLDRSPNPHVGFGFGIHNCLGAPQARLIIQSLLRSLSKRIEGISLIAREPLLEEESTYTRKVGYESLRVRFDGREAGS